MCETIGSSLSDIAYAGVLIVQYLGVGYLAFVPLWRLRNWIVS